MLRKFVTFKDGSRIIGSRLKLKIGEAGFERIDVSICFFCARSDIEERMCRSLITAAGRVLRLQVEAASLGKCHDGIQIS
jgi:hypothetical protein